MIGRETSTLGGLPVGVAILEERCRAKYEGRPRPLAYGLPWLLLHFAERWKFVVVTAVKDRLHNFAYLRLINLTPARAESRNDDSPWSNRSCKRWSMVRWELRDLKRHVNPSTGPPRADTEIALVVLCLSLDAAHNDTDE